MAGEADIERALTRGYQAMAEAEATINGIRGQIESERDAIVAVTTESDSDDVRALIASVEMALRKCDSALRSVNWARERAVAYRPEFSSGNRSETGSQRAYAEVASRLPRPTPAQPRKRPRLSARELEQQEQARSTYERKLGRRAKIERRKAERRARPLRKRQRVLERVSEWVEALVEIIGELPDALPDMVTGRPAVDAVFSSVKNLPNFVRMTGLLARYRAEHVAIRAGSVEAAYTDPRRSPKRLRRLREQGRDEN